MDRRLPPGVETDPRASEMLSPTDFNVAPQATRATENDRGGIRTDDWNKINVPLARNGPVSPREAGRVNCASEGNYTQCSLV